MSFNWESRKVRDLRRSIADRRSALGSCIHRLTRHTGDDFLVLRDRHAPFLGKGPTEIVTEAQLLDALAALERLRNPALERLRAFERQRIRAKLRGRRSPSKAEWRLLEDPSQ